MIESVRLENFKSFRDSTIPLNEMTLIIGANGAGKSNFFDAMRFLRAMGEGTHVRDAIEGHASSTPADVTVAGIRGGHAELVHFGSAERRFKLTVRISAGGDLLTYSIGIDVDRYQVFHEELKSRKVNPGSYVFSTHPEPNPLVHDDDAPGIAARFYKRTKGPNPRREFSRARSILSQFEGRLAETRVNETVAELVRSELASITPLELRPEVLRQYAPIGGFRLGEHGENFPAVVWFMRQLAHTAEGTTPEDSQQLRAHFAARLDGIRSWLTELTPHAITELSTDAAPTGEVIFTVREAPFDHQLTARSLSDGTLRFAALAFAVLGTDKATLFIEELENGIHPARLRLVLRMLSETARQRPDVQVVASTHSPSVLTYAPRDVVNDAIIMGWNHEGQCSHPVRARHLPEFEALLESTTAGELQAEGWFQLAADL